MVQWVFENKSDLFCKWIIVIKFICKIEKYLQRMADKIDAIATLNVEDHKPNREYKLAMLLKIGKKSSSFDDSFEQENLNFLSADHRNKR